MKNELRAASRNLNKKELLQFFISHLNRIFCAKGQLLEKLPEFGKSCYSPDMKQAINVTLEAVRNQIELIKNISCLAAFTVRKAVSDWLEF